jgi:glycosyltransferase involved in cell wall biosynthesis
MRLHIVSPVLPPRLDGIGDYTAKLASELACSDEVTILTERVSDHSPIPCVDVRQCFSASRPTTLTALLDHTRAERPDWLLVQYNPFAYGRWGLNVHLPLVINAIKRRVEETRIAIMFHEVFTPASDVRFTIMTTWQRAQLFALGRSADALFFSVEQWTNRFRRWFPRTSLTHLPVGSNIDEVAIERDEARARLGINAGTVALGIFGRAHPSRMLELTRMSAQAVRSTGRDIAVVYVGPDAEVVQAELGDLPLTGTAGGVPPGEVSKRLAAMDVYLAAFVDGVSTRRGSLMAGLQHGLPTVGTVGPWTDSILRGADGDALLLAPVNSPVQFCDRVVRLSAHNGLRHQLARGARALYEREFAWPVIASRLRERLVSNGAAETRH